MLLLPLLLSFSSSITWTYGCFVKHLKVTDEDFLVVTDVHFVNMRTPNVIFGSAIDVSDIRKVVVGSTTFLNCSFVRDAFFSTTTGGACTFSGVARATVLNSCARLCSAGSGQFLYITSLDDAQHALNFTSAIFCGTFLSQKGGIYLNDGATLLANLNFTSASVQQTGAAFSARGATATFNGLFLTAFECRGRVIVFIDQSPLKPSLQFCNFISNTLRTSERRISAVLGAGSYDKGAAQAMTVRNCIFQGPPESRTWIQVAAGDFREVFDIRNCVFEDALPPYVDFTGTDNRVAVTPTWVLLGNDEQMCSASPCPTKSSNVTETDDMCESRSPGVETQRYPGISARRRRSRSALPRRSAAKRLGKGALAGIIVAVVLLLLIVAGVVAFVMLRRRNAAKKSEGDGGSNG